MRKRILVIIFGIVVLLVGNYNAFALPSGAIALWKGEGNANDSIGTNNGSVSGATYSSQGLSGTAFHFDGINDSVSFGNTIGNFGTADFTMDFWIKIAAGANNFVGVVGKRSSCSHGSFFDLRMNSTNGFLSLELDQNSSGTNYNSFSSNVSINDGKFHNIAISRQGNNSSIYIDGNLNRTGSTSGVTNISNNANFTLGKSTCTGADGTHYFSGDIDEISVFNRALSGTEIMALSQIPEPASMFLFGTGIAGLVGIRLKRKNS